MLLILIVQIFTLKFSPSCKLELLGLPLPTTRDKVYWFNFLSIFGNDFLKDEPLKDEPICFFPYFLVNKI